MAHNCIRYSDLTAAGVPPSDGAPSAALGWEAPGGAAPRNWMADEPSYSPASTSTGGQAYTPPPFHSDPAPFDAAIDMPNGTDFRPFPTGIDGGIPVAPPLTGYESTSPPAATAACCSCERCEVS